MNLLRFIVRPPSGRTLVLTGGNNQWQVRAGTAERNDTAHANGNIFFNSEYELARKVRDVLRTVEEIQHHSALAISEGYKAFLVASQSPEEREYTDNVQQIEEVLVKRYYMSASDIAFCRDFDIQSLAAEPGSAAMEALHTSLVALFPADEEQDAA